MPQLELFIYNLEIFFIFFFLFSYVFFVKNVLSILSFYLKMKTKLLNKNLNVLEHNASFVTYVSPLKSIVFNILGNIVVFVKFIISKKQIYVGNINHEKSRTLNDFYLKKN